MRPSPLSLFIFDYKNGMQKEGYGYGRQKGDKDLIQAKKFSNMVQFIDNLTDITAGGV